MAQGKTTRRPAGADTLSVLRAVYEAHFAEVKREEARRLAAARRRLERMRRVNHFTRTGLEDHLQTRVA